MFPITNGMKILAIDPGYDRLGIAVMEKNSGDKEKLLYSECFSPSKDFATERRILEVGKKIKYLIKKWHPEALALEDLFFSKNQKTALSVAEVRGVIIYESGLANIPIYQFAPSRIKTAVTGNGVSDKRQVSFMVQKLINFPKIRLKNKDGKNKKIYDDEYDAVAVGLTFFAFYAREQLSTAR